MTLHTWPLLLPLGLLAGVVTLLVALISAARMTTKWSHRER